MVDYAALAEKTNAYKLIKADKQADKLSHAYLLISPDGASLDGFLNFFAQEIACEKGYPCKTCRSCTLIKNGNYVDVIFYPKNGDSVVKEDVENLIEESFFKPVEGKIKLFVLSHAETMNDSAQNKLLKTLEEPPKNVCILLGATSEYPILPTVKSRVKKLEIGEFSSADLMQALKEDCPDKVRLSEAVAAGDGTVGKAQSYYGDENFFEAIDVATDTLVNMKSSKDLLYFSNKISALKCGAEEFFSVLELLLSDMLSAVSGKEDLVRDKAAYEKTKKAEGFGTGALIYALDAVYSAQKKLKFNANSSMTTERLLFSILEGKFKWQKS